MRTRDDHQRIVITGVGVASPNGDNLAMFRRALLEGVSGVENITLRYVGEVHAGICHFDPLKYRNRKEHRAGTRAGAIAVYCAREAVADSGVDWENVDRRRCGIYLGTTEHGNVETENEVYEISKYDYDVKYWNHYHNPRTVANNPAGEVTINLGVTGPHYCVGAACAAGNAGIIQGAQQLLLEEVDIALAGGVSESPGTFGIFAGFKSQNALAVHADPTKASRPFDRDRNGIVISEGGGIFVLERLDAAKKRGAKIYAEILGYCLNSDAYNFVLPYPERQAECMRAALDRAGIAPEDVDILNTHATGTKMGDIQESDAVRSVFASASRKPWINNTKGFIGHAMGAAGALELAGNLPSFTDHIVHPCANIDNLDPECAMERLLTKEPVKAEKIDIIMNNSFGMLGINSTLLVRRYV